MTAPPPRAPSFYFSIIPSIFYMRNFFYWSKGIKYNKNGIFEDLFLDNNGFHCHYGAFGGVDWPGNWHINLATWFYWLLKNRDASYPYLYMCPNRILCLSNVISLNNYVLPEMCVPSTPSCLQIPSNSMRERRANH